MVRHGAAKTVASHPLTREGSAGLLGGTELGRLFKGADGVNRVAVSQVYDSEEQYWRKRHPERIEKSFVDVRQNIWL